MGNKIIVKKSKIHGRGVFAKENIKKGELICIFKGEVIKVQELKRRYKSGEETKENSFQIEDNEYLNLDKPYVFINHSCYPNSGFKKTIQLTALRNIKKGKEITYDYSVTEWSNNKYWGNDYNDTWWEMKCKCNSGKCRKKITEFQFLPQKVKVKYNNLRILPEFIKKNLVH